MRRQYSKASVSKEDIRFIETLYKQASEHVNSLAAFHLPKTASILNEGIVRRYLKVLKSTAKIPPSLEEVYMKAKKHPAMRATKKVKKTIGNARDAASEAYRTVNDKPFDFSVNQQPSDEENRLKI